MPLSKMNAMVISSIMALAMNEPTVAFSPLTTRGMGAGSKVAFAKRSTRHMAAQKEEPDQVIASVFGKELAFDEKSGRFFETKFGDEEKDSSDDTGLFDIVTKPKGTFFDELQDVFKKKDAGVPETIFQSAPAPAPAVSKVKKQPAFEAPSMPAFEAPSFFDNFFKPKKSVEVEEVPRYDPVTVSPDFRVAGAFVLLGLLLDQIPYIQLTLGPIVTLLGLLFLVQSFRIRFVFNEDNEFELVNINPLTGKFEDPGENLVVGGANVWACDTIVNYDFFPAIGSNPVGPVLVYFKETQTDSSKWNEGPGAQANDQSKIARGEALAGQVHFFPCVCNAEQIRDEFAKRECGKL